MGDLGSASSTPPETNAHVTNLLKSRREMAVAAGEGEKSSFDKLLGSNDRRCP